MARFGVHQHREVHRSTRVGWLRAAVLGADDGLVSTAALVVGVAASDAERSAVLVAGLAGLVAGATSMAAGEYVSVSSQRDAERADIARESQELSEEPESELAELTQIYVERGLDPGLAREVAHRLTRADALGAHARDELGLNEMTMARPLQAALASAAAFAAGAVAPIAALLLAPSAAARSGVVVFVTLVALAVLGALGGQAGGAPRGRASLRVTAGGALAMGISAVIGALVGIAV
ncbi:MAG: VIT family protein [Acidimicrobiia bacterium]|nr:VIT family protein [Acidimicrobiia bacterium]